MFPCYAINLSLFNLAMFFSNLIKQNPIIGMEKTGPSKIDQKMFGLILKT